MRCIIIEDQPPAQRILKKYIADYGSLELVNTFTDAIQGIDFLKSNTVDLIFLDIHLPKISGIDFLKTLNNPPAVILTTAFPDFALESYEFDVIDYLLKPFSFPRFIKAVSKVKSSTHNKTESRSESIFIKSGHEYIKVDLDEILFIKSDKDYTEIVSPNSKLLSNETLKHWEDTLDSEKYIRVHKSYLINKNKIVKLRSTTIDLEDNHEIPIGRAYKDDFVKRVNL